MEQSINMKIMAKATKKKELDPVNVHDKQQMIDLGLHPKDRVIYDFSKTPEEKAKLKKLRRQLGRGFYNQKWMKHEKPVIPVNGKLVVYVYGEPTKSIECNQADIPGILLQLKAGFTKKVVKYRWNGRTYEGNELPFWQPRVKGGISISLRS